MLPNDLKTWMNIWVPIKLLMGCLQTKCHAAFHRKWNGTFFIFSKKVYLDDLGKMSWWIFKLLRFEPHLFHFDGDLFRHSSRNFYKMENEEAQTDSCALKWSEAWLKTVSSSKDFSLTQLKKDQACES